ncbi:allene oxide synthase-lipoxygenase protein-like [Glandiceps talaboti]
MGALISRLMPDIIIHVRTGDVRGGGTDATVHLILYNKEGTASREIVLHDPFGFNFEVGDTNRFFIRDLRDFCDVVKIEIWRDAWFGDDWFVDYIEIEDYHTCKRHSFPIQRWVGSKHLVVYKHDCFLPQNDPEPERRQEELKLKRELYKPGSAENGIPIMVKRVPKQEEFSMNYEMDILKTFLKATVHTRVRALSSLPIWTKLDDITNIYNRRLPIPKVYSTWKEDWHFGRLRLQGLNPYAIKLCTEIPSNLAVTDEMLKPFLEDMTLDDVIAKKRLFIVNYDFLKDLPTTNPKLVVCAPIALFFLNSDKDLMPVAIQLFQDKSDDNPVFLPTDPEYTWMLVKMFFNNAESAVHESSTHLAFTHLVVESFAVCTHRNLSPSHPIFRLLGIHFMNVIAINYLAFEILLAPGWWIDQTMSSGRVGMLEIIRRQWKTWRLDVDGTLPNDFKKREVDDPEVLPNYPFRDDAILLYDAIKNYVTEVITGHYDEPEKIAQDTELQAWASELSAVPPEGFGVKGIPGNGSFSSTEEIIEVITSMITICSVGHAAVNFPQYNQYAFPPNYPGILRGKPPTNKEPLTEKHILEQLQSRQMTLSSMVMVYLLSQPSPDMLGYGMVKYQSDPIATQALAKFRIELKKIGDKIEEREKTRQMKYPYLHPTRVPNSVNI